MFRSMLLRILTVAFLFSIGMPFSADAQIYLFPVASDAVMHLGLTTPLDGPDSILLVTPDVPGDLLLARVEHDSTNSTVLNMHRDSEVATFAGIEFNDHSFSPEGAIYPSGFGTNNEPIALILVHAGGLATNTGLCGSCHSGKESRRLKRSKHGGFWGGVPWVAGRLMA